MASIRMGRPLPKILLIFGIKKDPRQSAFAQTGISIASEGCSEQIER